MKKSIFLSTSIESELNENHEPTGKKGKVVWLNFKSSKGASAMINLNNLAHRHGSITKKAIQSAITEYED